MLIWAYIQCLHSCEIENRPDYFMIHTQQGKTN
jgi:hypothetical protein